MLMSTAFSLSEGPMRPMKMSGTHLAEPGRMTDNGKRPAPLTRPCVRRDSKDY
jgi:hypothetical protein